MQPRFRRKGKSTGSIRATRHTFERRTGDIHAEDPGVLHLLLQDRYRDNDLCRVAVVPRAKEAGFSLEEIRELIAAREPADRTAILGRRPIPVPHVPL